MAKLILSAFADEYSDSLEEQCEVLNSLGIGYIELRHANGKNIVDMTVEDIKNVKCVLKKYGIKVSSIGSPIGKIPLDGDMEKHLRTADRVFGFAAELGAKYCRVFSFYLPDGKTAEECRSGVIGVTESLMEFAEKHGVTLCHENEALIYGESPENCLDLLTCSGGRLKCVFDMGNFVLDGYDAYEAYEKLFGYIEYFHIKDALSAGAVVPAGKGEACIKRILDDYRRNGKHDAFITLEPHLQTFEGLNALVGKNFDNPYKYDNTKTAFLDAYKNLRSLL